MTPTNPRPTKTIQQFLDETKHQRIRMVRQDIKTHVPTKKSDATKRS
jgi:hypothetical protein